MSATLETDANILSQELIEIILNLLENHKDVQSCSLVCHRWRVASSRRLFSTITVPPACLLGRIPIHPTRHYGFDDFMIKDAFAKILGIPDIYNKVTDLTIDWYFSKSILSQGLKQMHNLVFPRLRNLTVARFSLASGSSGSESPCISPLASLIKRHSSRLRTLAFYRVVFLDYQVAPLHLVNILRKCRPGKQFPFLFKIMLNVEKTSSREPISISITRMDIHELSIEAWCTWDIRQAENILGRVGLAPASLELMDLENIHTLKLSGVRFEVVRSSLSEISVDNGSRFDIFPKILHLSVDSFHDTIPETCPNILTLGIDYHTEASFRPVSWPLSFISLKTLHSLRKIIFSFHPTLISVDSTFLLELDRALIPAVRAMPWLDSVEVVARAEDRDQLHRCFPLLRAEQPDILHLGC
ncbi:hypothetical protein C8J55DRAFT_187111 [Lentinula edodes]|uniref:F-box domain-containing protein n=1 Tax=Lentinula lateritia TaxID=40482 RepID=A0A9W8ZXX5_9AGAR|nr:hypothetical protein C8J55DRAFT_187111 [Lentinula edodes]